MSPLNGSSLPTQAHFLMMRRSTSAGETPLDALKLSRRLLVLPILQAAKSPKVLDGTRILMTSSDRHTTWARFE